MAKAEALTPPLKIYFAHSMLRAKGLSNGERFDKFGGFCRDFCADRSWREPRRIFSAECR